MEANREREREREGMVAREVSLTLLTRGSGIVLRRRGNKCASSIIVLQRAQRCDQLFVPAPSPLERTSRSHSGGLRYGSPLAFPLRLVQSTLPSNASGVATAVSRSHEGERFVTKEDHEEEGGGPRLKRSLPHVVSGQPKY